MRGAEILEVRETEELFGIDRSVAFDEIPTEVDEWDSDPDKAEDREVPESSTELDLSYDKNASEVSPLLRLVREAGQDHPLLTAEQERELGKIIQLGQPAQERIDEAGSIVPYASWEVVEEMAEARRQAITKMCMANVRWLRVLAQHKTQSERGMTEEECLQAGFPGLHRAAEKFDPWKGYKFSTYAQPWIIQAIQRAPQNREIVKEPVAYYNDGTLPKYAKLTALGLSPREIAEALELDDAALQDLHTAYMLRYTKSFDQPVMDGAGKPRALHDVIPDGSGEQMNGHVLNPALHELVESLKSVFKPNEIEVLIKAGGGSVMGSTEKDRLERVQALVTHPSLQRVIRQAAEKENPWDDAKCKDMPELFLRAGVASSQLLERCLECPLLEACQELTERELPTQGIWAGIRRSRTRGTKAGYAADGMPLRLP